MLDATGSSMGGGLLVGQRGWSVTCQPACVVHSAPVLGSFMGHVGGHAKVVGRVSRAHKTGGKKKKGSPIDHTKSTTCLSCANMCAGSKQAVCRWQVMAPAGL